MQGEKLTLSQLEQYLSKAAWILKGPVDASDFKVYIFPLLFFKRVSDVYDEEYQTALAESDGDTEYANLVLRPLATNLVSLQLEMEPVEADDDEHVHGPDCNH